MSAMTAYFIRPMLPYDFESAKLSRRRAEHFFFTLNQPAQPRLAHCLPESIEFLALPFRKQFHPTIVEIAHRACDFESSRDRLHCVTKSDSLHAARIKNGHP